MDDSNTTMKDYIEELLRCEPPPQRKYPKVQPEKSGLTLKQRKKILAAKKKKS